MLVCRSIADGKLVSKRLSPDQPLRLTLYGVLIKCMCCVVSVTLVEVVKSTLQLVPVMSAIYVQCHFSFVTIVVSSTRGRVVIVKNDTHLFFCFLSPSWILLRVSHII